MTAVTLTTHHGSSYICMLLQMRYLYFLMILAPSSTASQVLLLSMLCLECCDLAKQRKNPSFPEAWWGMLPYSVLFFFCEFFCVLDTLTDTILVWSELTASTLGQKECFLPLFRVTVLDSCFCEYRFGICVLQSLEDPISYQHLLLLCLCPLLHCLQERENAFCTRTPSKNHTLNLPFITGSLKLGIRLMFFRMMSL